MAPLLVSLLFLLCTGVQSVPILIKFRMTFIQPMEPLLHLGHTPGGLFLLEVVLFFLACVGMRHCFFIWLGFPQLKHLALAAFCTLKVSNATNFVLWDIDPISLYAFKYSIREPVFGIGLSTDRHSSLAFSKTSCLKIIFCKVTSLLDFSIASFNFPIN